jgi:penicillin-binding protein 2
MLNSSGTNSNNFNRGRILVFYVLITVILAVYLGRLFSLQILQGSIYKQKALNNSTSTVTTSANRGIIYDRNGFVLAQNIPSYNVSITPALLPEDEGTIEAIYSALSEIIDIPVNNGEINDETVRLFKPCDTDMGIAQIVEIGNSNWPYNPVNIKCNVDENVALAVKGHESDWPGVSVEISSVRDYPTGELTSEIIGFMGPIPASQEKELRAKNFLPGRDKIGYAGIESSMQDELAGKNGVNVVEIDVAGKEIRNIEEPQAAVPGNNIKLTIDSRLQLAAKTALKGEIDFWNRWLGTIRSQNGVVIAINPKTGEILAMVSYPTYENNRMARQIPGDYYEQLLNDQYRPLFNHAISAEHPPGSVFKMSAAIGALNEKVVTPEQQLDCKGKIDILQRFYPNDPGTPMEFVCYNKAGHGMIDFIHGVAQSCDVYFYKIGGGYGEQVPDGGLGILRLSEYAKALGYGSVTGVELPGEAAGLIPTPQWKRINLQENWSNGDTYIATIGQGYVLSTPMQVLLSFATLANDGKQMQPTLIGDILDNEGKVVTPFTPKLKHDITKEPLITIYEDGISTDKKKVVEPWVIEKAKEGMRLVVTEGTMQGEFSRMGLEYLQAAGKTGTAEYCDNVAQARNLCQRGNWPTHAWFVGYAPYDNPEIAVVAFVYNGGEGASVAGPIVGQVLKAYFNLKASGSVTSNINP